MKKILFSILATIVAIYSCHAQSNISIGVTGFGFEFGDAENASIYKLKIGDGTKALLEPGIRLGAEVYATPATSIKFAQTFRIDEMQQIAMSTQAMIRFRIFRIYKHSLSVGIGPTAFYRQTWQDFDGYVDEGVYTGHHKFQGKISWLSAEVEYNYVISKYNDLSFCVTHMNPESMGFAIGFKHWFSRKSNKCGTCPSFH